MARDHNGEGPQWTGTTMDRYHNEIDHNWYIPSGHVTLSGLIHVCLVSLVKTEEQGQAEDRHIYHIIPNMIVSI